jgi:hypothetical protein
MKLTIFAATGGIGHMLSVLDNPETFHRTVGIAT